MLVGWGGNNGTTVTAAVLANKLALSWPTRNGHQQANYYGSLMMSSTVSLGMGSDGRDVYIPFHDLLPMVHPDDIVLDGWDISSLDLASAMERARVLEPSLQVVLLDFIKPCSSVYENSTFCIVGTTSSLYGKDETKAIDLFARLYRSEPIRPS